MKSPVVACLSLALCGIAPGEKPLAEAARPFAGKLPAGCIVTGEWLDGKTSISIVGKPEPDGVAAEKRVFEIGSISKVFTGLLLADAVLAGKVRLDSSLAEILGKEQAFADPRVGKITLLQLATHTSGLPRLPSNMGPDPDNSADPYGSYDRKLMLAFLATAKLDRAPPFPASYSNFGVGLLGELLAQVHGKPWAGLVTEKITGPLGMSDTLMVPGKDQAARLAPPYRGKRPGTSWTFQSMAGAGALRSTAADLLAFGQALLDPDKTPLSAAIKEMLKVRAPYDDMGAEIGLGILIGKVDGRREYSHSGGTGGYRTVLQVIPELKRVRVVLINNDAIPAESVLLATRDDRPSRAPERKLAEEELDAFTGVFDMGPQARFTVLRRGDELHVRLTGQPFAPVVPVGKDRFRYTGVAAELQFTRDGGTVASLTLHQNGREIPAKRSGDAPANLTFPGAEELKAYPGEYELAPGKVITVTANNGTLFARLTGQPAFPVFQTEPGRFEYDVVEAALEFQREKDGPVTGLVLHQNGKHTAKKR